jgi:hypothetical protein
MHFANSSHINSAYKHACVRVCACMCACMCACINSAYKHACVRVYVYTVWICGYLPILCVCMYVCMYVYIYVCVCNPENNILSNITKSMF